MPMTIMFMTFPSCQSRKTKTIANKILILLLAFLVTGCASTVHLNSLTPPKNPTKTIQLKQISYGDKENPTGLVAGEYKPEFENAEGVFYMGPERCVLLPNARPYGGLFVPYNGNSKEFKIYYYLRTPGYVYSDERMDAMRDLDNFTTQFALSQPRPQVGPALAGGLIGGAIVDAIIASEGEIHFIPPTEEVDIASFVTISP